MALLKLDGAFDLTPNAFAPLAPWAEPLRDRARFEERGRGPEAFDCWGLVGHVQLLLGRAVRDYSALYSEADFGRSGALDRLIRAEAVLFADAERGEVGDILVCAEGRAARHVAVLCGAGRALHIARSSGALIEPIVGRARVSRFAGRRIVGCVRPA